MEINSNNQKEKLAKFIKNFNLDKLGSENELKEIASKEPAQRKLDIEKKLKSIASDAGITESTLQKQTSKYKVEFEKGILNIKRQNVLDSMVEDADKKIQEKYGYKDKDKDNWHIKHNNNWHIIIKIDKSFVESLKGKSAQEIVVAVRQYIYPQMIAQVSDEIINKPINQLYGHHGKTNIQIINVSNMPLIDLLSEVIGYDIMKILKPEKENDNKLSKAKANQLNDEAKPKEVSADENGNGEIKRDPKNPKEAIDDMAGGNLDPTERKNVSELNKDERQMENEQSALLPPWLRND